MRARRRSKTHRCECMRSCESYEPAFAWARQAGPDNALGISHSPTPLRQIRSPLVSAWVHNDRRLRSCLLCQARDTREERRHQDGNASSSQVRIFRRSQCFRSGTLRHGHCLTTGSASFRAQALPNRPPRSMPECAGQRRWRSRTPLGPNRGRTTACNSRRPTKVKVYAIFAAAAPHNPGLQTPNYSPGSSCPCARIPYVSLACAACIVAQRAVLKPLDERGRCL